MKAIVAMTPNRVIGAGNRIPWRLPQDLRWFKRATMGHPVLMGRMTFESIGKPLPGRRNLVASRHGAFPGVEMVRNLEAFDPSKYEPEVIVMGGAEIYRALLDRCDELLVTRLKMEYAGDRYFPEFTSLFRVVEKIEETPEFEILRYARSQESEFRSQQSGARIKNC